MGVGRFAELVESYSKMKKHGVVIYGAGVNGREAYEELKTLGINILAVADRNAGVKIKEVVSIGINELLKYDSKVVCLISTDKIDSHTRTKIEAHFQICEDITFIRIIKYNIPNDRFVSSFPYNHYDSPYLSLSEIDRLKMNSDVMGIDLRLDYQEKFIEIIRKNQEQFDKLLKNKTIRYKENNGFYDYEDALVLNTMIQYFRPDKIIEIGSGFSSFVSMDTNESFFQNDIDITCIEPYPDRLKSNLKHGDENNIKIYEKFVQDIDFNLFETLQKNDILFIDSSHVAKEGGDVLYEYFDILPRLKSGVIIHIHDIFNGFRYPLNWLKDGFYFNEAYILRALLTDNSNYEIIYFNNMMHEQLVRVIGKEISPGGSLWIRKK